MDGQGVDTAVAEPLAARRGDVVHDLADEVGAEAHVVDPADARDVLDVVDQPVHRVARPGPSDRKAARKFTQTTPPVAAMARIWSSVRLRWWSRSARAEEWVAITGRVASSSTWATPGGAQVRDVEDHAEALHLPQRLHARPRSAGCRWRPRRCRRPARVRPQCAIEATRTPSRCRVGSSSTSASRPGMLSSASTRAIRPSPSAASICGAVGAEPYRVGVALGERVRALDHAQRLPERALRAGTGRR